MTSQQLLLPILQASDWAGHEHVVCWPLAPNLTAPDMPWAAFGYQHPHSFEYCARDELTGADSPERLREIVHTALRNLSQRQASWAQQVVELSPGLRLTLLVCSDDLLACEHILNRDFMRRAHVLLQARLLAVAAPRRGLLLAIDAEQPRELVKRFITMASSQFSRAESERITPLVFLLDDGITIGAISCTEAADRAIIEAQAELEICVRMLTISACASDEVSLQILAGGANRDRLARALVSSVRQGLQMACENERFNGALEVALMPELTPPALGFAEWVQGLELQLQDLADDLRAQGELHVPASINIRYDAPADPDAPVQEPDEEEPSAEQLAARIAELDTAGLLSMLREPSANARSAAAARLGELGEEQTARHLIVALGDESDEVCVQAAGALAALDAAAVPLLLLALEKGRPRMREYALHALAKIDAEHFVDVFMRALDDPEERVRRRAAHAVKGLTNPVLLEPLVAALSDPSPFVRMNAASALRKLGDSQAVEPLINALRDPKHDVRVHAAFALGDMGASAAVVPLIDALRDSSALVRAYAAQALRKLGDSRAIPALVRAICDHDTWVMRQAAKALIAFGEEATPVLRMARDRLDPKLTAEWYQRLDEVLLACSDGIGASVKRSLRTLWPGQ